MLMMVRKRRIDEYYLLAFVFLGIILPSEQCDLTEDGTDEQSESVSLTGYCEQNSKNKFFIYQTGDNDDRRLSSGGDDDANNNNNNNTVTTETTIVVSSSSSSNNENESPINNTNTSTTNVSTTDPYKDFSGVDTESFITTTLRNNPKDRTLLLQLETLLQQFIQDDEQTSHQFQAMNSCRKILLIPSS